ncbi:PAS domain-containing protein, partial [Streptomyces sp. NPDC000851]
MSGSDPGGGPHAFECVAAAVLDDRGTVLRWTGAAKDLTGFTAEEVCGRPVQELVVGLPDELHGATETPASGRVRLGHRSGDIIDVTFRISAVEGSAEFVVLAAPAHHVADREQGAALLRALSSQDRVTIALHDTDLATVQTNAAPGTPDGRRVQPGTRLCDVLCASDAEELEAVLRQVLETGAPVIRRNQHVSWRDEPTRRRALSLSAFRLEDARGRPTGVAALYVDGDRVQHLDLTRELAERVGSSPDVVQSAQALADLLVPAFGDLVTVDLAQSVFDGDEPPKRLGGGDLGISTLETKLRKKCHCSCIS